MPRGQGTQRTVSVAAMFKHGVVPQTCAPSITPDLRGIFAMFVTMFVAMFVGAPATSPLKVLVLSTRPHGEGGYGATASRIALVRRFEGSKRHRA